MLAPRRSQQGVAVPCRWRRILDTPVVQNNQRRRLGKLCRLRLQVLEQLFPRESNLFQRRIQLVQHDDRNRRLAPVWIPIAVQHGRSGDRRLRSRRLECSDDLLHAIFEDREIFLLQVLHHMVLFVGCHYIQNHQGALYLDHRSRLLRRIRRRLRGSLRKCRQRENPDE